MKIKLDLADYAALIDQYRQGVETDQPDLAERAQRDIRQALEDGVGRHLAQRLTSQLLEGLF